MAPLLLVGPALCVELGLGPALTILLLALVVADRRATLVGAAFADPAARSALGAPLRWLSALAVVALAAVLVAIAARTIAAATIAFPAAIWTLGLGLVVALVGGRLGPERRRGHLALVVAGALAIPPIAALGERHEAAAVDARGSATSGPILGIHPFQVLTVIVDGHGPYDIPINDYVEPDGSRGYGPVDFADALERALHRIAALHYADGPARARQAYADATVTALELPATHERLDRADSAGAAVDPRFVVRSGSHGQRSRVEFVCPGLREDPRGPGVDDVMERMCPARHAAEGSAGLGVTGRWTGYTEARGNERLGLGRLLGWTRSDDAIGRRHLQIEATIAALAVIALGLLLALRRRPAGIAAARSIEGWGAWALALAAAGGALLLAQELQAPVVGALERPPVAIDWLAWLPLAALFAGLGEIADPGSTRAARLRRLAAGALVLVATLAVAGAPAMTAWIRPELGLTGALGAFEAWIIGVGERLHLALGIDLAVAEASVASLVVAGALALCVRATGALGGAAASLLPLAGASRWARIAPPAAIAAMAAGLVTSRQTEGGALLLGPALLLSATVVAAWLTRVAGGRRRLAPGILLLACAALTLAALAAAWSQGASPRPIRAVYLGLGAALTMALTIAGLVRGPRSGP